MRVLLVSTYEMGRQPLHVASPAAALVAAGHEVRVLDSSVQDWDEAAVAWAGAVAFSVPMHTATRLALRRAAAVRDARPDVPIALYGLYAGVGWDRAGAAGLADVAIAGEYETALVAWVDGHHGSTESPGLVVDLRHSRYRVPRRDGLPGLDRYARLARGDDQTTLAGYVEASHGCLHRCRHCPVPVVYDGRMRIVAEDVVLADVAAQVEAGAGHVTFGDPDFLNGPRHALRIVGALHRRFPDVTFDCTTKVEHILRHADLWPTLAEAGCLFVVSAFESVDDETLRRLDKGHTTPEAAAAVALLRGHGIEIRPSFLPFTPWTTPAGMLDLLDFVAALDLVDNVDPVQYTIRLLVPAGSLLLGHPDLSAHLDAYDADALTWRWTAADPAADALQARLVTLVAESLRAGEPAATTYLRVRTATLEAALGRTAVTLTTGAVPTEGRPRLTESWFC